MCFWHRSHLHQQAQILVNMLSSKVALANSSFCGSAFGFGMQIPAASGRESRLCSRPLAQSLQEGVSQSPSFARCLLPFGSHLVPPVGAPLLRGARRGFFGELVAALRPSRCFREACACERAGDAPPRNPTKAFRRLYQRPVSTIPPNLL